MLKIFLILICSLSFTQLIAQDDPFEQWNLNYREINLSEMLSMEQSYADSIENKTADSLQFYFRADKYRFNATFSGKWRGVSEERKSIMAGVFKMIGVDQSIINSLKKEVEISTEFGNIWMPIQPQLEKPFKKEIPSNSKVYIYAFFINQHSATLGLNNICIISEFTNGR